MQNININTSEYTDLVIKYNLDNYSNSILYINYPTNAKYVLDNFISKIPNNKKSLYINNSNLNSVDIFEFEQYYIFFTNCVEKAYESIKSNIQYINLFNDINIWNFCIYENMMFNLPFTLENIIFIPISFILQYVNSLNINKFVNTLIHEKIHISQRFNHNLWNNFINHTDNKWIKISKNYNTKILNIINNNLPKINNYFEIIVNPDTDYDDFKYIYKLDSNLYFGQLVKNNSAILTKWFLIDIITNELISVNELDDNNKFLLPEHEHPYEIYAYSISNKII